MMIAFADSDDNCGSLNAKFQVCQNILLHKIPTGSQPIPFRETTEDPPCPAYHFLLNRALCTQQNASELQPLNTRGACSAPLPPWFSSRRAKQLAGLY
jgi:hypothetical protein